VRRTNNRRSSPRDYFGIYISAKSLKSRVSNIQVETDIIVRSRQIYSGANISLIDIYVFRDIIFLLKYFGG